MADLATPVLLLLEELGADFEHEQGLRIDHSLATPCTASNVQALHAASVNFHSAYFHSLDGWRTC